MALADEALAATDTLELLAALGARSDKKDGNNKQCVLLALVLSHGFIEFLTTILRRVCIVGSLKSLPSGGSVGHFCCALEVVKRPSREQSTTRICLKVALLVKIEAKGR